MFFDGQGFMVNKETGISSARDLKEARIRVSYATIYELRLMDFSNRNDLNIISLGFEDTENVVTAYEHGQCDAATADRSQLAAFRSALSDPDMHTVLPETISEEPFGPMVPHGDSSGSTS